MKTLLSERHPAFPIVFILALLVYIVCLNAFPWITNNITVAIVPFACSMFCMLQFKKYKKDKPFYALLFLIWFATAIYILFFFGGVMK